MNKSTNKNLSKKVMDEIKSKSIHPKPKWEFLLKNYVFWGAFGIFVLVGALAASVTIFRISTNDWAFYKHFDSSFFLFTVKTLPYFWLLLLPIFIFVAYYNFKHTKKGYKYSFPLIVGSSFLISVLLGFAFFGIGLAEKLEDKALRHLPLYEDFVLKPQLERWTRIEDGALGGEILSINENISLNLENFEGEEWEVLTDEIDQIKLSKFKEGMVIAVIGDKIEEGKFKAEEIHPWRGNFVRPPHMRPPGMPRQMMPPKPSPQTGF